MTWDSLHPEPGVYDVGPADQIVAFAERHGHEVRGHAVLWHSELAAPRHASRWTTATPSRSGAATTRTRGSRAPRPDQGAATVMFEDDERKPAYWALHEALAEAKAGQ